MSEAMSLHPNPMPTAPSVLGAVLFHTLIHPVTLTALRGHCCYISGNRDALCSLIHIFLTSPVLNLVASLMFS